MVRTVLPKIETLSFLDSEKSSIINVLIFLLSRNNNTPIIIYIIVILIIILIKSNSCVKLSDALLDRNLIKKKSDFL